MKPFNGYKAEAPAQGFPMLPKGLYIAKVSAVRIDGTEPDQRMIIRTDIIEGDYTAYYSRRYKNDLASGGKFEVRYKGDFALQIPDQANTRRQHFDWDLRNFNNTMWAFEDSNEGYHWDWNEQGLVGKIIGLNVREGSFNGIPYTTIGRLDSVKMIREGKVKVMKDMAPRTSGGIEAPAAAPGFTPVEDEDIPF